MMRTNEEFKAEIFRRKNVYLKKRNARIGAVVSTTLVAVCCLAILMSPPRNKAPSSNERESFDVMVSIHLPDRVLTDGDEVGPRLELLSKYVPLPEGECTVDQSSDSNSENADDFQSYAPPSSPESQPSNNVSLTFTVVSGNDSKTYFLKENAIVVDGKTYPLTEAEFNELFALFGGENAK